MGIFGGYLAGARAAREDKMRERQQDEVERRARSDEALRQSEADRAQANADRQFEQSVAQADRDYALRRRAAEQDAALKAQDIGLRQALGELEYAMKGDEMQGRREDRALTRDIKQQEAQMAREEIGFKREKMGIDRELAKDQLAGAKEDRQLRREESQARREESAANRALRQQGLDQGAYQFERTQANADARLGLELDKSKVETSILEEQRAELRRKREERTKEREMIGKSNMMGLGLVFDNLLSTPVGKNGIREMDSGDLAEIVKMYPQFANIEGRGSLMGGACVVNPETGRAEIKLMYGDGKNVTSQSSFDELGIMRGLRAAGYGEDSVNSQLNLIRPEPTVMKLKKMTTQDQMKQKEIRETERLGDERRHKNKMEQIKFKQALESVDTEIHNAEMLIAEAERNKRDGWETIVSDQRDKIEAAQKKKNALLADGGEDAPTDTPAPTADPLVTKYGKYLKK